MIPSNGGTWSSRVLDLGPHLCCISSNPCSVTTLCTLSTPWESSPTPPSQNRTFLLRTHRFRCSSRRTGPYWDSSADSVRTRRFRPREESFVDEEDGRREKRKWWSDDDSSEFDEDSELYDERPWDKIWILKVLRSFGWTLPAIILSMLIATGPKAFLMALALPLGQSVLSLAIDKVWGKVQGGPKRKSKTKRKPFARDASTVVEEEESSSDSQRWGYQTWVATDDGVVKKGSSQRQPSFGGWDDLDRHVESDKGLSRQSPQTTSRSARPRLEKKGKLTRRVRNAEVPLFLRLLIAVFPFLGSWTKIL